MDTLIRRNVAVASKPSVLHWVQAVVFLGIAVITGYIAFHAARNGSFETVLMMGIMTAMTGVYGLLVLRWIMIRARPVGAPG